MAPYQKKIGTKTSAFGSPGRINHDSSSFYKSRLYDGLPKEETIKYEENSIPLQFLDKIFVSSSEHMMELPDNSVHLMVTSPPYIEDMLDLGFLMRGEVIWNKASSGSPSTAWGSWLSAKNPILRDIHEYILVFSKGLFSRENTNGKKSTISKEEFLEFTKSVWTFSAESARKVGHPAPFPVELPLRLIKLYTFEGDVVLDPFMGSGQTALAALKASRHYVGYDISKEYVTLAEKRIKGYLQEQITLFSEPTDAQMPIIAERPRGKGYQVKNKHRSRERIKSTDRNIKNKFITK